MPRDRAADPLCTVLIPAYNEAPTIRAVVERALPYVDRVIVISDGSTDGTADRVRDLPVEVIEHAENLGKGRRLAEGIAYGVGRGADCILTLDADGQHDPGDIPAFIEAARRDPGALVMGHRLADRAAMPRGRAASIAFGDFFISWSTGRRLRDGQCGMRLYPASLWPKLHLSSRDCSHFVFETAVLLHAAEAGCRFARVPIRARYAGFVRRPSRYRPVLDTWRITCAVSRFLLARAARPRGLLVALGITRQQGA